VSRRLDGRWAVVLVGLLVSACAVAPRTVTTVDPAAISAFLLEGRFNLKVQKEAFPGRVRWQHGAQTDDLWFYSPLGATVAHLRQDASGALLVTSNGEAYRAEDLNRLAYEVLGWDLPLAGLPFWVRGLAWPAGGPAQTQADTSGQLERLSQAGWNVSYLDWSPASVAGLPSKLDVQGERMRMRLVVERWTVDANPP